MVQGDGHVRMGGRAVGREVAEWERNGVGTVCQVLIGYLLTGAIRLDLEGHDAAARRPG